jgi:hypothetical protein
MSRRNLLVFGMLVLGGFGGWYFLRTPSDTEMIARFRANRAVFDQLVLMYIADNQDMWIGADGNYLVEAAYPSPYWTTELGPDGTAYTGGRAAPADIAISDVLSIARRMEYEDLLNRAGVAGIGRSTTRNYRGPHRTVPFLLEYATSVPRLVYSSELLDQYGYPLVNTPLAYATDPANYVPTAEDTPTPVPVDEYGNPQTLYPARDNAFDQTSCRRIEEHWYFCTRDEY